MKEYTDEEFARVVDACAAEVKEMLRPKITPEPKPENLMKRIVAVLF